MSAAVSQPMPQGPPQGGPPSPWDVVGQQPLQPPQEEPSPAADTHLHAAAALGAAHHAGMAAQEARQHAETVGQQMDLLEAQVQMAMVATEGAARLASEASAASQNQQHVFAAFSEVACAVQTMAQSVGEMATVLQSLAAELKAPRKITIERDGNGDLASAVSRVEGVE